MAGRVVPFEVHIPQHELDDLRERLARTRWLDEFPGSGWSYGTSRRYLEELCEYWRAEFDWRAYEARLSTGPTAETVAEAGFEPASNGL